ncbi:MAG: hypothetical protein GY714_29205 [Desulfobacterales bacterium]|nr:hypothetical protein [Desulfobacterales bacterium]MCP4162432.1 hypothetical protein [Deltaproteobacteria bacterium]
MTHKPNKLLFFLCLILCMLMSGFMVLIYLKKQSIEIHPVIISEIDFDNVIDPNKGKKAKVVDLNKLDNKEQKKEMDKRKAKYGLKKEIDAILNPDESIKIDKETIPMKKILDKVKIKEGSVVEESIKNGKKDKKKKLVAKTEKKVTDKTKTKKNKKKKQTRKKDYGIHIVKRGENIWNIHFEFLKNYFAKKNIILKPRSDEPLSSKKSSGVGKLLKFSERMVYIYSVADHKLTDNIHSIEPNSKIIVYNMEEVFDLLGKIDYSKINEIHFDGKTIWLPEK